MVVFIRQPATEISYKKGVEIVEIRGYSCNRYSYKIYSSFYWFLPQAVIAISSRIKAWENRYEKLYISPAASNSPLER